MADAGPTRAAPLRLIADAMLGRLARWLRVLGYDTAYERAISDEGLIARALADDRWVLTRDRYLARRKVLRGRHTSLSSDRIEDQLRQVHQELGVELDIDRMRGVRCAQCNGVLLPISPREAAPLVPAFVAQHHREFLRCPHCHRVFWPGTHWDNFGRRLAQLRANRDSETGDRPQP